MHNYAVIQFDMPSLSLQTETVCEGERKKFGNTLDQNKGRRFYFTQLQAQSSIHIEG